MITGIVPKMAIRFTSFDWYKSLAADPRTGTISSTGIFFGEDARKPRSELSADSLPF